MSLYLEDTLNDSNEHRDRYGLRAEIDNRRNGHWHSTW
jgi:hypothetical protein